MLLELTGKILTIEASFIFAALATITLLISLQLLNEKSLFGLNLRCSPKIRPVVKLRK